jgi:uncharacterized membrane protein YraQ (UPF0718 family)
MDDGFHFPSRTLWFSFSLPDFLLSCLALIIESAPFLLLGALISAAIETYVPIESFTRWFRGSRIKAIAMAFLFSFLFPVCECAAVPIVAMLLRRGVPPIAALTYLLASPLVNPLAVISTLMAFYGQSPLQVTLWRVGLGALIIFATVMILAWSRRRDFLNPDTFQKGGSLGCQALLQSMNNEAIHKSLARFVAVGTHSFLTVLPYLMIGCALASVFNTGIHRESTEYALKHPVFAPLASIFFAQLLCLCSTTDAFIIVAFFSLSLPAKIAFLIAGPLMDIRLFILYKSLFTVKFVTFLWIAISLLTWILTLVAAPMIE